MINAWLLTLACLLYVGVLFAIARWGDRSLLRQQSRRTRGVIYSLALAVYCTSWTFFGAVGSAVESGWLYLPIYLGPALTILFAWPLIERIIAISRRQRLTTIADFISARYGRSRGLGVLVTIIATVGAVPYIALQLKAVVASFQTVSATQPQLMSWIDPGLVLTLLLASFAILFGTRKVDITEHHDGMMLAIAFESLVKLVAFLAVGALALWMLGIEASTPAPGSAFSSASLPDSFFTQLLLAAAAIFCLPRQFHVGIVEARSDADTGLARWLFPGYLLLFTVAVIPITMAGMRFLAAAGAAGDTYVLALPMSIGNDVLTMFAFIGGFSAATSMVIVACVALSTMISNEIVVPLLVRLKALDSDITADYPRLILFARRLSILLIALAALSYYRVTDETTALASIGLLSFAAAAQFAPLIVLGVYWPGAHRTGALAGLIAGFALWTYTLFLPALTSAGALPNEWLVEGLFGIPDLRPEALLFDLDWHPLTHGVAWSLGANVVLLVLVSLVRRPTLLERSQAQTFAGLPTSDRALPELARSGLTVSDLQALAARFVGVEHSRRSFAELLARDGSVYHGEQAADMTAIRFAEKVLSGAIGAASARVVVSSALRNSGSDISDVLMLLDETGEAIRFNRELLETTLENMSQGVSVVDDSQRLIGWNRRYLELMNYSETLVHVGQPIEALIRHNAALGRFGDEDVEAAVEKRLGFLRSGSAYTYESHFADGQVIQIRGQPMARGGYVTTYSDITAFKEAEREMRAARDQLEQRVQDRTNELQVAMGQLSEAKQEAERANQSKTHFLAAAAHDLLQPLNATKLFAALLHDSRNQIPQAQRELVERVHSGLDSVESLLTALLDIAKLDTAAPTPSIESFSVRSLFAPLSAQFSPVFEADGLTLRFSESRYWVQSDAALLRRILQNFISNARRYTERGGVLVGCRLRGDHLALQVIDTGPGIADEHHVAIFDEFRRLPGSDRTAKRGLGLGLAIVRRIARLLDHPVAMRSRLGQGSVFEVLVPRAAVGEEAPSRNEPRAQLTSVISEHILCVDNEPEILDAMRRLLSNWGALPATANSIDSAVAVALELRAEAERWPAILLVDYHLDDGQTGLQVVDAVRSAVGREIPAIVLTADHSDAVAQEVALAGHRLLRKPVRPAMLRALLHSLLGQRTAA